MSDYIRREDVLNLPQSIERNLRGEVVERSIDVKAIESLESADVVQVVRCRDCKYMMFTPKAPNKVHPGDTHPDLYHCYKYRQFHPLIKPDSDFCSYGEREE